MSLPSPLVSSWSPLLLIGFRLKKSLPSFKVLNYLLNLSASCLDDENEIQLKVIASLSAVRFALPSIPLIVLHSLVIFNKISHFFRLCAEIRFWMSLYSLGSSNEMGSFFAEVVSSGHHIQYLCCYRFLVDSVPSSMDVVRCCF